MRLLCSAEPQEKPNGANRPLREAATQLRKWSAQFGAET